MKPRLLSFALFLLCVTPAFAQNTFRVMFYNVENLFDPEHDDKKNDTEFTPDGARHWDNYKYYKKINNLSKVISSVGEWGTVALVGLCEVENERTMEDLTKHSPIKNLNYRYVMTKSKDIRGIDVALLYQRDQFKYLYHKATPIIFPYNKRKKTRDVLHVTGVVQSGDTLDVFVCHFPSRRGGQSASEPDRQYVANIVRGKADSLQLVRKKAHIVIMGDFNDEPNDKSIAQNLTGKHTYKNRETQLHNLWLPVSQKSKIGSYKFGKQWNFLDQIIVSEHLLNPKNSLRVKPESATIFQADFLLTDDKTHHGKRPKKTFHGRKYEAGYSDHLPVFVDFVH